jgi:hypothetical protein
MPPGIASVVSISLYLLFGAFVSGLLGVAGAGELAGAGVGATLVFVSGAGACGTGVCGAGVGAALVFVSAAGAGADDGAALVLAASLAGAGATVTGCGAGPNVGALAAPG